MGILIERLWITYCTPHPVFSTPAKAPDVSPTNRDMYEYFGKCSNFAHFPK